MTAALAAAPDPATGRTWLLRLGLSRPNSPVQRANGWCRLVDHTALLGRHRLLVVLGVRRRAWAARAKAGGGALAFAGVRLLHLAAVQGPDAAAVNEHLEYLRQRAGVPRSIVSDRGADVLKGIRLFETDRPAVAEVCDFKHFAANRLKALLQAEPAWAQFQTRLGQTRAPRCSRRSGRS